MRYKVHMVVTSHGHVTSVPLNEPSTESLYDAVVAAKKHMAIRRSYSGVWPEDDDVHFEIVTLPF